MIKKQMINFDLDKISRSGQCFRMAPLDENGSMYSLIAFDKYLEIEQLEDCCLFSCSEEEWEEVWNHYFDCDTDYGKIYKAVDTADSYLNNAVLFGKGIRILRQELFETTISFIISQQNNIPRIRKCVEKLCSSFGEEKYNFRGEKYYAFPTPARLSLLSLEDLRACGLGYRDKYIVKTAGMFANSDIDTELLAEMEYENAKRELLKLSGVGVKVAECICLFSLHHVDAFPIDTHIESVLIKYYPKGFPFKRYTGYAGILQQYAFYYDLYGEKINKKQKEE